MSNEQEILSKQVSHLESLLMDRKESEFKLQFIESCKRLPRTKGFVLSLCSISYDCEMYDIIIFLSEFYYDKDYLLSEYCKVAFLDGKDYLFYRLFPVYPWAIDGEDFRTFLESPDYSESYKLKVCIYVLNFNTCRQMLSSLAKVFIKRKFSYNEKPYVILP